MWCGYVLRDLIGRSKHNTGFSYSDDESMYTAGDEETAELNYQLIIQFFERFPAFLSNDMYISSESYGGHCKYPTICMK